MPNHPALTQGYTFRPVNHIPPRPFKSYPYSDQNRYDKELADALCVALGAVTQRGKPIQASLKAVIHIVCNYRYRAEKKYPKDPCYFVFHYSRNESRLRESNTGMTEKVISLIDLMTEKGFIDNNVLEAFRAYSSGRQSTFSFTSKFVELMDMLQKSEDVLEFEIPSSNYMGIEFSDDNVIVKENLPTQTKEEIKNSPCIPIGLDTRLKRSLNHQIGKYNKLLNETEFDLVIPHSLENSTLLTDKIKGSYREFDKFELIDRKKVRRHFADNRLTTHGRIYGGFWQQIPSYLRSFITINGNETVELDYNGLQPNILFTLAGAEPLYDDVYHFPDIERDMVKSCFMYLLNAKDSKANFIKNLKKDVLHELYLEMEDYSPYHADDEELERLTIRLNQLDFELHREHLYDSFEEVWSPIWPMLGSREWGWRELTKLDSDIAYNIIKKLTASSIPVLTVHDSFIIEKQHESLLVEIMAKAYKEVIGSVNGRTPRIKKKYLLEDTYIT